MKSFKPKMSGADMSPEAHAEWMDKGGKHVSGAPYSASAKPSLEGKGGKIGMAGKGQEGKMAGASMPAHESHSIAKGHGGKNGSLFAPVKNSGGFPTGPMKGAGAHMGKIPADGGIMSDTPKPVAPQPQLNDMLGRFTLQKTKLSGKK